MVPPNTNKMSGDLLFFRLLAGIRADLRKEISKQLLELSMPLSIEQVEVIICLGQFGELTQQELARLSLKDKASISRMARKLEQLGLTLTGIGYNHKNKLLKLTPEGFLIFNKFFSATKSIYEALTVQLSRGENQLLMEILIRLHCGSA
jgi:DNA-binding MarR family transcriptional regulator